jgi:uncharacterized membrane protein YoaK (UPF0700 family)
MSEKSKSRVLLEGLSARVSMPSVDSRAVQVLLVVLSITAGCADVIGFLGLSGLFILVILVTHVVGSDNAQIAPMLSVPVFIIGRPDEATSGGLESIGFASLCALLLLHFLSLARFLVLCVAAGPSINLNAANAILAGMLGDFGS